MRDYISLTKPRITWLILMSTAVGYFFGLKRAWFSDAADWAVLLNTLVGTGLIASGTAALNQWYERDADTLMRRTSARPLPSGKMTAPRALWFGIALAVAGMLELGILVNVLSAVLGALTLASYLFLYTPLKQRSHLSTVVGALPGAMPPLIGYAASYGGLTPEAWTLFAILFVWQFPHFLAIAWMYREDYARAGFEMISKDDNTGARSASQSVLFCIMLLLISGIPQFLGLVSPVYLVVELVLNGLFIFVAMRFLRTQQASAARRLFLTSIAYLPLLLGALVLTKL
jgi:heme o synthase